MAFRSGMGLGEENTTLYKGNMTNEIITLTLFDLGLSRVVGCRYDLDLSKF